MMRLGGSVRKLDFALQTRIFYHKKNTKTRNFVFKMMNSSVLDTEFSALSAIQFEISQTDPSKTVDRFQKYDEIRQR